jgi:peptidoglycan glycosyltransferase
VTPLQMAEVASAVANGGVLMQPRLTSQLVNQDGQVVQRIKPAVYDRVMSGTTASELTKMMQDVVEEGTGQAAQLDGLKVAGKTGTATIYTSASGTAYDDAWFIGFAPVAHPKIAVAVELTDIKDGYGGTWAAPIAAQVMKTLLAEGQ